MIRQHIARLRSWLRAVLSRQQMEREMQEELRFHMESYAEDLQRQGVSPAEARRQAKLAFGGTEGLKEDCRQSLGLRLWDELRNDVRGGLRVLRQSPVFTLIAVGSLALGIGANTAIFTLANEVLLRSLDVPDADRLRLFTWATPAQKRFGPAWGNFWQNQQGEATGTPFPYALYQQMRKLNRVMDDLVGFHDVDGLSANFQGHTGTVDAVLVSGNFFEALKIRMEAGRSITTRDDAEGVPAVAVISDAYWSSRFHRTADALGSKIEINAIPVTIIGVSGPEFRGPRAGGLSQVFLPLALQQQILPNQRGALQKVNSFWWVVVMGRLLPGITDEKAEASLTLAFRNAFLATMPEKRASDLPRFFLDSGQRGLDVQKQLRRPVYVLLSVAGLVLLIACANLANLLLARAAVRHREISLRLAMGAGRMRIMRQLLTESLLLALFGGSAGLLLGYLSRNFIPRLLENSWQPSSIDTGMDWRVFCFALFVTSATVLLFGIIPAWRSTKADPNHAIKESRQATATHTNLLFSKSLVVFQVALSVLLVVSAGLFLRTLSNLRSADTGINPEQIVLFEIRPPQVRYSEQQRVSLFREIADGLAELPGVQRVTSSSEPLLADAVNEDCFHPVERVKGTKTQDSMHVNYVAPDFFETYGIRLATGRSFARRDNQPLPKVAVINRQLAKAFFPDTDPLGRGLSPCGNEKAQPFQIVGISADAKYSALRENPPPTLYIPYAQADDILSMTFAVKTAASLGSLLPKMRDIVRSVDKTLPLLDVRTQNQQIDAALSQERVFAVLTTGFGLLALLLASIGIYGVMAYSVSRRTNEIGIRMALGAPARKVLRMVLTETSLLTCAGILVGVLAAYSVTRLIASMLFGLAATDPLTFFAGAFLMQIVALLAALIPAWRAATVDPMVALRHD